MRVEYPWSTPQFTHQDGIFIRAIELGCTPVLSDQGWACQCPRAPHGMSTTYPVLSLSALARYTEKGKP